MASQPSGQIEPVREPLMQFELTKEERKVIRDVAAKHAILYQIPLTVLGCAALKTYMKKKLHFGHAAACFVGASIVTDLYTRSVYKKELLEKYPDGAYAQYVRQKEGFIQRQPMSSFEQPRRVANQRNDSGNMDFNKDETPTGFDDRFMPPMDGDDLQQNQQKEEIQRKKYVSYSDLRTQHRRQYEDNIQQQQPVFDIPRTPRQPHRPVEPQQPRDKRNKYGDIITDE